MIQSSEVQETPDAATIREAFNIFSKLITLPMKDPDRMRRGVESLAADWLGDPPISIPRTTMVEPAVIDLLRAFLSLNEVHQRFADIETMVKYYPWRGKISRGQHMEHCYFLMAHEAYILEERLKRFLKCVSACASGRGFAVELKAIPKEIMNNHNSIFGSIVAARGMHVHEEANIPRDIKRIGELELHMRISDMPPLAYLHRDAVTKARKHWMSNAEQSRLGAEHLCALVLQRTRIVWEPVIQEAVAKLAST